MINITDKNRENIIDRYTDYLLDNMDFQTLWTFAKEQLTQSKDLMSNEPLEQEILEYYPEVLENE